MMFDRGNVRNDFWPVYAGRSFNIWDPDAGECYASAEPGPVQEWLQRKRLNAGFNPRSPHSEFTLEYRSDVSTLPCTAPRIAFRDITNSIDRRTVIACLLPPEVFLTNKAPYFLWPRGDEKDQAFLLGVLCSIPLDWYARRFVATNVSFFIINSFPIPRPERNSPKWNRVTMLAGRLAAPDNRFEAWAKSVGVDCGPLDEEEKADKIHELDAVVAHLYGLGESQLAHVFDTFREGWQYHDRLERTMEHFRKWAGR